LDLRLIEIYCPESESARLDTILGEHHSLDIRRQKLPDNWLETRVLLPLEETERLIDVLSEKFMGIEGFRVIVSNVGATIPRPKPAEETTKNGPEPAGTAGKKARLSREELYHTVSNGTNLSRNFIVLTVLSSIVAALGLYQNSLAIIIGAMLIAPLLGPIMALALATTLGDTQLALRGVKTGGLGLLIVLALSAFLGFILQVDPSISEIATRTEVKVGDIIIALASGSAGVLAFTSSLPAALVGVMVAAALLPPLVTLGLLLGGLLWQPAIEALSLVLINIVAINLAAVGTFIFQGIRPANWWEAEKAKKATRIAFVLWLILLASMATLVLLFQHSLLGNPIK
jgi:uncharacterized hydrophobic protein (TIGR00341 family)